ncbi:hypothetical protein EVAR_78451_1 [Eumeta japonica]|uniref:Uncharacterized protein n=1 Tax=Eumeta variegata TaxID=151549 RepID=A0A4C1TY33_EUMVA|nr:hypothetical protein EVAR_78451_1 [Eumeta japonica]
MNHRYWCIHVPHAEIFSYPCVASLISTFHASSSVRVSRYVRASARLDGAGAQKRQPNRSFINTSPTRRHCSVRPRIIIRKLCCYRADAPLAVVFRPITTSHSSTNELETETKSKAEIVHTEGHNKYQNELSIHMVLPPLWLSGMLYFTLTAVKSSGFGPGSIRFDFVYSKLETQTMARHSSSMDKSNLRRVTNVLLAFWEGIRYPVLGNRIEGAMGHRNSHSSDEAHKRSCHFTSAFY